MRGTDNLNRADSQSSDNNALKLGFGLMVGGHVICCGLFLMISLGVIGWGTVSLFFNEVAIPAGGILSIAVLIGLLYRRKVTQNAQNFSCSPKGQVADSFEN